MAIQFTCGGCNKKLQAPETSAGKQVKCPECGTIQVVPEEIVDAVAVQTQREPEPILEVEPAGPDRRPCPQCGEMILATAVKCRFCGEIFDATLRRAEEKKKGTDVDADMTTGDWVVAVLCSGIGCIIGIIWLIQGKPKAGKMVGVSLLFAFFWAVIRGIIEVGLQNK